MINVDRGEVLFDIASLPNGQLLACGAAAQAQGAAAAQRLEGRVTRVTDGDSLWVRPASGGRPLEVRREKGNHHTFGPWQTVDLATMDVILMRQDPPFDMNYITATHLLEWIVPAVLVKNGVVITPVPLSPPVSMK